MTGQLDLFADGSVVMLRNDVITALRARDAGAAHRAAAALAASYPNDALLPPIGTLLEQAMEPNGPFSEHGAADAAIHKMDTVIAPSAHLVFGPFEADAWLAPVWTSLATAAAALAYDPQTPQAHAAFMSLRAGDWPAAQARVLAISSWRRMPVTLAWMAEARFGVGGMDAGWPLFAELAWINPSGFAALARRLQQSALPRLLVAFRNVFEPDDDAALAWLPAWALVSHPGLASVLRNTQVCNDDAPERAARLVMELLALERQGRHADLVVARKRLREMQPILFASYMATR